jgi:hypothetical protein
MDELKNYVCTDCLPKEKVKEASRQMVCKKCGIYYIPSSKYYIYCKACGCRYCGKKVI